ncbi:anti-sigma factor family protein [Azospirillum picis]|uniref:Anti-sigma factor RsiW n=1 Tax=Azospirillum picis TaxID=488438 RepID=A0ABU0MRD3_9PROT|nr:anti-sigma factor [Azospirillum picis]MBP2302458.1 anti-sigma factor RsiW [Azospirillum picis]MDQ0536037.1 anti-sigma factor RsiW [Azospirillum picis]
MTGRPIAEEDLHAYIDDALDPVRRDEVQAYLDGHADVARRVAAMAEQRRALRAAFAPVAEEPVPSGLSLPWLIEKRRRSWLAPWQGSWRSAAAALLLLGLGGLGGWFAHLLSPEATGIAALKEEAAANYAVYASDRVRPVELRAADRDELLAWVSKRLKRPVALPDLSASGYRFMGGRLVATAHGPAGLFLYDDDRGTRVAMLVRPMAFERDTPMSAHEQGTLAGFAWADQGLGYSLMATAPAERLHPLADEVRRQVDGQLRS